MTIEPTGKKPTEASREDASRLSLPSSPSPSPRKTAFDSALSNCIDAAREHKAKKMAALATCGERGFSEAEELEDATARANLQGVLAAIISESGGDRNVENSLLSQAVERLDMLDRNYSERLTNYHLRAVVERDFPAFVEALATELDRFDSETGDIRSRIAELTDYTLSGIDLDTPIRNFGDMCIEILLHDDSAPDTGKNRHEIAALVQKSGSVYGKAVQRIRELISRFSGSANESEPMPAIKTRMLLTYTIVIAARHDSGIWLALKAELDGLNGVATAELPGMNSAVLESDAVRRRARMAPSAQKR